MNILKTITFFPTLLFKKEKRIYTVGHIHPTRDWLFGLFVTVLLVVTGAFFSAHQFMYYKNIDTQDGVFAEKVITYDATTAQMAVSLFSKRKNAFTTFQNTHVSPLPSSVKEKVATTSAQVTVPKSTEPVSIPEPTPVLEVKASTGTPVVAN